MREGCQSTLLLSGKLGFSEVELVPKLSLSDADRAIHRSKLFSRYFLVWELSFKELTSSLERVRAPVSKYFRITKEIEVPLGQSPTKSPSQSFYGPLSWLLVNNTLH